MQFRLYIKAHVLRVAVIRTGAPELYMLLGSDVTIATIISERFF